jgi:magnesium transporter
VDYSGLDRSDVSWIDLFDPSESEEKAVEAMLRMDVPSPQEVAEIEESARLYEEAGTLVMTAVVINGVTEGRPSRTQMLLHPHHRRCRSDW